MDLILWRHAQAQDAQHGMDDLERSLTGKGERQAQRMAAWLDRTLPLGTRIICSPALRCEQTVLALGRPYKLRKELSPDGQAEDVLQLAQWPLAKHAVLVVGHQPYLGQVVSLLMKMSPEQCSIKRGALWWLRSKSKGVEVLSTRIQCVQHPEML